MQVRDSVSRSMSARALRWLRKYDEYLFVFGFGLVVVVMLIELTRMIKNHFLLLENSII